VFEAGPAHGNEPRRRARLAEQGRRSLCPGGRLGCLGGEADCGRTHAARHTAERGAGARQIPRQGCERVGWHRLLRLEPADATGWHAVCRRLAPPAWSRPPANAGPPPRRPRPTTAWNPSWGSGAEGAHGCSTVRLRA
jgi:hypothetical protein